MRLYALFELSKVEVDFYTVNTRVSANRKGSQQKRNPHILDTDAYREMEKRLSS